MLACALGRHISRVAKQISPKAETECVDWQRDSCRSAITTELVPLCTRSVLVTRKMTCTDLSPLPYQSPISQSHNLRYVGMDLSNHVRYCQPKLPVDWPVRGHYLVDFLSWSKTGEDASRPDTHGNGEVLGAAQVSPAEGGTCSFQLCRLGPSTESDTTSDESLQEPCPPTKHWPRKATSATLPSFV